MAMTAADGYIIREKREDEKSTVASFLEQHYYQRDNVIRMYLKKHKNRIDEVEKKMMAEDIEKSSTILAANVPCLVAVHRESKEIAGLTLMLVEENPKFSGIKRADECLTVQLSPVKAQPVPFESKLLEELATYVIKAAYNTVDLFAEFSSQRTAMKVAYLCVDPEHYGRGLATRFMREAVSYAENKGIGFVYGVFTSPYSRRAAEKNGFEVFSEVDVVSLRDNDGNDIFQGEESYIVTVMAKQVTQSVSGIN